MKDNLISAQTILIIDDDPDFCEILKSFLFKTGISRVFHANDYDSGRNAFQEYSPDICILDIDLGVGQKYGGIEIAKYIRSLSTSVPIIFVTALYTEEIYLKARSVTPSSFINKDLSVLKILNALDLAIMHKEMFEGKNNPPPSLDSNQYFFKIGNIFKAININDIYYLYSKSNASYAHVNGRNYPTSVNLKTYERILPQNFIRVHKSYIININFVESINIVNDLIIIGSDQIPIGTSFRQTFFKSIQLLK